MTAAGIRLRRAWQTGFTGALMVKSCVGSIDCKLVRRSTTSEGGTLYKEPSQLFYSTIS